MSIYYLVPLLCFSLWDYYIPPLGGRVLDYVGIALILVYLLLQGSAAADRLRYSRYYLVLVVAMLPSVFAGYFTGKWLTVAAFLAGALFIYSVYFSAFYDRNALRTQTTFLISINLIFFVTQYVAFKVFGVLLDYHSYFGAIAPRVFNPETGYFRAAGLFQEPNSFCLMLYMLYVVRMFQNNGKLDGLLVASLVAMFLSESLWGLGAIVVLSMMHVSFVKPGTGNYLAVLVAVGLVGGFLVIATQSPTVLTVALSPTTVARMVDIGSDPSLSLRYGTGLHVDLDTYFLLGHGMTTEGFQDFLGANAISFYVYSFGLVGLLLFVSWLMVDAKSRRLRIVALVLFAMSSYPLFTYAIWWAWLGILISDSRRNSNTCYA